MKGLILQKLYEQTGIHHLRDVRFFLGEMEYFGGGGKNKEEERGRSFSSLTTEDWERIQKVLSGINDFEMREILSRVYSKGLAAGKNRGNK